MHVKFYHTLTCPQCKVVERLLQQHYIQYESCTDPSEILADGINHTPVLEVDGQRFSGRAIIQWINGGNNG